VLGKEGKQQTCWKEGMHYSGSRKGSIGEQALCGRASISRAIQHTTVFCGRATNDATAAVIAIASTNDSPCEDVANGGEVIK